VINMRRCSNCDKQTEFCFTTNTYTRKDSEVETASQITECISPVFDAAKGLHKLPAPRVSATFPETVQAKAA